MACKLSDIFDLYLGKFDFYDCPHCGAKASIGPSLAGFFLVEDTLLVLDRGFDPEPAAREALAQLVVSLGASLKPIRVADTAEFRSVFAAKVKAVARTYPYPRFDLYPLSENIVHWRHLQGEVLTSMLAGAHGVVPKFGIHAARPDGEFEDRDYTVNLILDLIFQLMTGWSLELPALTAEVTLEEVLLRLVDSCSAASYIADRLIEMLTSSRQWIEENDADRWLRFHFQAVGATIFATLGRDNPWAGEWAYEYLLVRCAARRASTGEFDDRFLLSPKRIAATISYEHAWNAVATVYGLLLSIEDQAQRADEIRVLVVAVEDLGYKGLFGAFLEGGLRIGVKRRVQDSGGADAKKEHTPESLAALILAKRAESNGLELSRDLKLWHLSWFAHAEAVTRLLDLLEPVTIGAPEQRADLLTWFGERMKLLGEPARALARIGKDAAPWEDGLSMASRRRLWTERSNAFRLAGDRKLALKVAKATLDITIGDPDASDEDKATAWLNCGILFRENGTFAEAESCLQRAFRLAPDSGRWQTLQSLAATYIQMGRMADAAEALELARKTAGGVDNQDARISMLVSEIAVRQRLGQHERANALLRECPTPEGMPEAGLIGYGTILRYRALRTQRSEEHRTTAAAIVTRLTRMVAAFEQAGNPLQAQNACHSAAMLAQAFDLPDAEALWQRDAAISIDSGRLPDSLTAIELAICRIREDPASFDECVAIIPGAIRQQAGGISVNAMTLDLLSPLDGPFERLTALTFEQGLGPDAVQILSELRRNAHRKARATVTAEVPSIGSGFATAQAMRPGDAAFVVLEWCDIEDEMMLGLVTYLVPGEAEIVFQEYAPGLDLAGVAGQVGARLGNWRRSRAGEPHIVPQWETVTRWLRATIGAFLAGGGHVVIIDHPALTGLPFHIALAPEWTVSYAADWLVVEAAVRANGSAPASPRLGVLHAPRSNETTAVRVALAAAAARVRQLADAKGFGCESAGPGSADADALRMLLASTDLLKVLCHGQVSKEAHEVVLVIDHGGQSPPGYSFGATLQTTRGHRFGREELEGLSAASRSVFLGACSSGAVSVAGLDERTSLAVLLGDAGTKSVVAPRWKIDAEMALPVLDDAIERFVGGLGLAEAVSEAAVAAVARGVPSWQANAFVVEGAWI